jgi:inorganic triphosphatase YgiF
MGREFELKFRSDADKIALIKEKYGIFTTISMETTYYDTPDRKLSQLHCTLRRRMENETSVCTYKCPHKDGGRGEWEVEAANIEEGVIKLCEAGASKELLFAAAGRLVEVCGARFTRLAASLEVPGATVELALDQGVLIGNGKELPFAEVEVELKEGTDETAAAFASALAQEYGLIPEAKSKFARAMALAMG